jgi:predicted aspartyl protease
MNRYDINFMPPAPVTEIKIINPNNGNNITARMQIDTGADCSCLPSAILDKMGKGWITTNKTVRDFDGNKVECKAYNAIIEYFGASYNKRFYIRVQGDVGILGRDIVNEYKIELDGKRGVWKHT